MKEDRVNIRLSKAERNKLEEISNETGLNFAQIFRHRVLNDDSLLNLLDHINQNMLSIKEDLAVVKQQTEANNATN
jgi:hypothetical protein